MTFNHQTATVVELDFQDLLHSNCDLHSRIESAYGPDGLGILTVKNSPNLDVARKGLLPLAYRFGTLDEDIQSKYIHAQSNYSFGWSHGKENLEGKIDRYKGSFYANPQYDIPCDNEVLVNDNIEFIHPNIWPKSDLPELEFAFKELGLIIIEVGILIAKHCDKYIKSKNSNYHHDMLQSTIEKSLCNKGRLLHYYPLTDVEPNENMLSSGQSSWCGWHNDHGSITGLTSAMYMNSEGEEVVNEDINSGLYICNRQGDIVKVKIPNNQLAFQIGETAQILSGGLLQATPHSVKGSNRSGISRETFAIFMEPNYDVVLNSLDSYNVIQSQSSALKNLPKGVPSLSSRWIPGQTFAEFTKATLNAYY